jgi:3-isopropylmalate/(R)-2-methylmalate dehydratase small subunit
LDLDIQKGILKDLTNGAIMQIEPLPPVMIQLLNDGGLVEHIKKNGDFKLV